VLYNAKTKKFVMWFHLERASITNGYKDARCGVAISDSPTGPYQFVASLRPDAGVWPDNVDASLKQPLTKQETAALSKLHLSGGSVPGFSKDMLFRRDFTGGQMSRDMTLFMDDDGSAYLIHASEENATLHLSQLTDDYLKTRGRYIRLFPGDFNEAPAMFKRQGKYYLFSSNCNGWLPTDARSAVADSIWGPWTKLGNPCRGPKSETKVTFHAQSTYILPVAGKPDAFIFMADRWNPKNLVDSRYIWLPITFEDQKPVIRWYKEWKISSWPAIQQRP
jgi:hypothetical protein